MMAIEHECVAWQLFIFMGNILPYLSDEGFFSFIIFIMFSYKQSCPYLPKECEK